MNLYRQKGSGGGEARPLSIEMPPMVTIIPTMPYVSSVSFSIFAYTTVCEYNRLILIMSTWWPEPPQINFLPSNFNVSPGKNSGFLS